MKIPTTPEEAQSLLDALEEHGGLRPLSRHLGKTHSTVQQWISKARKLLGHPAPVANYQKIDVHRELNKRETRLLMFIDMLGGRCSLCLQSFPPCAYDFHHVDPTEKEGEISRMIMGDLDKVTEEVKKCLLLCSNCHRIAHQVQDRLFKKRESEDVKEKS